MIEVIAAIVVIVSWMVFVNCGDDTGESSQKVKRINNPVNPFGAVTRDSYGRRILPDKRSWNESPEFYAAQCEVDDYLRDHK